MSPAFLFSDGVSLHFVIFTRDHMNLGALLKRNRTLICLIYLIAERSPGDIRKIMGISVLFSLEKLC